MICVSEVCFVVLMTRNEFEHTSDTVEEHKPRYTSMKEMTLD